MNFFLYYFLIFLFVKIILSTWTCPLIFFCILFSSCSGGRIQGRQRQCCSGSGKDRLILLLSMTRKWVHFLCLSFSKNFFLFSLFLFSFSKYIFYTSDIFSYVFCLLLSTCLSGRIWEGQRQSCSKWGKGHLVLLPLQLMTSKWVPFLCLSFSHSHLKYFRNCDPTHVFSFIFFIIIVSSSRWRQLSWRLFSFFSALGTFVLMLKLQIMIPLQYTVLPLCLLVFYT